MKKKTLIILQARMTSKRLPYKSASLVKSIPLAILCALRLSNKGHDLILATSKDSTDDYLVKLCNQYKINVFRGDLKNVLKRYIQCTKNLPDETVIVRATADNPLNDGNIVNFALREFNKNSLKYFNMPITSTNLPMGLGVEVVRLSELRKIFTSRYNSLDKQHVTWKLAKAFEAKSKYYTGIKSKKKIKYRVTVDNFFDYFFISDLLKKYKDILKVSWRKIINNKNVINLDFKRENKKNIKHKLILGGAQIGMNYGFKNERIVNNYQLDKILDLMGVNNINTIDTAQGYQLSEEKLGEKINDFQNKKHFFLFDKINEFKDISKNSNELIKMTIYINLYLSMYKLKIHHINVLMIHSVKNFFQRKKIFKNTLLELKKNNLVGDFGISIYTPSELLRVSKQKFFKYIQIPFNIIDDRWKINLITKLKKENKFKIIARSIFLRGYLLHNNNWPRWFLEKNQLNKQIKIILRKFKLKNNLHLCMKYVNSSKFVDYIVIGSNNSKQFKDNLLAFDKPKFLNSEMKIINKIIKIKDKKILDARNF